MAASLYTPVSDTHLTREDCSRLLEVQKKTGARVMVGQVVRSFGEYRYLKDIYEKKTYGKLKSIVMQRISGDTKWGYEDWFHEERKSGSVVLDLHIHDLDFLRYMPVSYTHLPGGYYFNNKVRGAVASFSIQLILVTDNHKVRLYDGKRLLTEFHIKWSMKYSA